MCKWERERERDLTLISRRALSSDELSCTFSDTTVCKRTTFSHAITSINERAYRTTGNEETSIDVTSSCF